MPDTFWELKIQAFLHDPPEKVGVLGLGHERIGGMLLKLLGIDASLPEKVRLADRIASGADRLEMPKGHNAPVSFHHRPVLVHPIAGTLFNLDHLRDANWEELSRQVQQAVGEIARHFKSREHQFLALWRLLAPYLEQSGKGWFGKLWHLLPADTRVPDHTIWDHARLTSALVAAGPSPALLGMTWGPVQGFIAQSRKATDLWGSSYILARLGWEGMKIIASELGPDQVLYPDLWGQPIVDHCLRKTLFGGDDPLPDEARAWAELLDHSQHVREAPTLPNRFVALVSQDKAADLASRIAQAQQDAFQRWAEDAAKLISEQIPEGMDALQGQIQRQTAGFLEVSWAVQPFGTGPSAPSVVCAEFERLCGERRDVGADLSQKLSQAQFIYEPNVGASYGVLHELLDRKLGAVKLSRLTGGVSEPGWKCSVCGEREPLWPAGEELRDARREESLWGKVANRHPAAARPGEALCAICLLKRRAHELKIFQDEIREGDEGRSLHFPSTSSVAVAGWLVSLMRAMERLPNQSSRGTLVGALEQFATRAEDLRDQLGLGRSRSLHGLLRQLNRLHIRGDEACTWKKLFHLDGDLFHDSWYEAILEDLEHPERATGRRFRVPESSEARSACQDSVKATRRALRELRKKFQEEKVPVGPPPRYLAVVMADGDHMGHWVSGTASRPSFRESLHPQVGEQMDKSLMDPALREVLANRQDCPRPLSPAYHAALSRALRDFALRGTLELLEVEHTGKVIYVGGDDVLAFLPLDQVPTAVKTLRDLFSSGVQNQSRQDTSLERLQECLAGERSEAQERPFVTGGGYFLRKNHLCRAMGPHASLSAGVVIVHHQAPLNLALKTAHRMEQAAKDAGRDALGLALVKRSGETLERIYPFLAGRQDSREEPLVLLDQLVQWFEGNPPPLMDELAEVSDQLTCAEVALSTRVVKEWAHVAQALGEEADPAPELLKKELGRLFRRHLMQRFGTSDRDAIKCLKQMVKGHLEELTNRFWCTQQAVASWRSKNPQVAMGPPEAMRPGETPQHPASDPLLADLLSTAAFLARGGPE